MDVFPGHGFNSVGHKVVLHAWVNLYDVPTLATHVQITNGGGRWHVRWTLADGERMRSASGIGAGLKQEMRPIDGHKNKTRPPV